MPLSQKQKLIFSIIAGAIHHFSMASIQRIGSFSVYYLSYLHHHGQSMSLYYAFLMTPIATLTMSLSIGLGGLIEKKVGSHKTIVISTLIGLLATSSFLIFPNTKWLGFVIMFCNGFGCGLSYLVTNKNACSYYPEKKGLITACVSAFGGLGATLFTFLGETIINPENLIIPKEKTYFDVDIADNFFNYIYICLGVYPVGVIITLLFLFEYKEEDDPNKNTVDEATIIATLPEEDLLNPISKDNSSIIQTEEQIAIEKYKSDLKKIFKNRRVWILFAIIFCTSFLFFLVLSTSKTIGSLQHFDTQLLKYTYAITGILMGFMAPLWGFLYDKLDFQVLIRLINIIGMIIGIGMVFAFDNQWLFSIFIILNSICFVGMMCIFNPHVMKVFTFEYTLEVGGCISIATGLSNISSSLFAFIVSITMIDHIKTNYNIVFIIGTVFFIVSFLLSFYESNDPFDFRNENQLKKDSEKQVEPIAIN